MGAGESKDGREGLTISLPADLAAYLREQATREVRTVSNMVAFMVECYRREHPSE